MYYYLLYLFLFLADSIIEGAAEVDEVVEKISDMKIDVEELKEGRQVEGSGMTSEKEQEMKEQKEGEVVNAKETDEAVCASGTVQSSEGKGADEFHYVLPVLSSSAPKTEGVWQEVKRRSVEKNKCPKSTEKVFIYP